LTFDGLASEHMHGSQGEPRAKFGGPSLYYMSSEVSYYTR